MKYKRTRTSNHYNQFSLLRSQSKKCIRDDDIRRHNAIQSYLVSHPAKFWNHVAKFTRPKHGIDVLVHEGHTLTSDADIANCFGDFFHSVFIRPTETFCNLSSDFLSQKFSDHLNIPLISNTDVLLSIRKLKPSMSLGPDNIPAFIVKGCSNVLAPVLCSLFNKSLKTGTFPSPWKSSVIIPIFKKGTRLEVKNYRPIALLSVFSKNFEKIIYSHLYGYIDKYLSPLQHGFRRKMSTMTNLVDFLNYVSDGVSNRATVDVIYFDVSKAFDVVNHHLLVQKLERYGLSPLFVNWFKSYLADRSLSVKINDSFSAAKPIFSGVPQGSTLGPLLFLIFINDLPLSITCPSLLFADDLKIFVRYHSDSDGPSLLQHNINCVVRWYHENGLSINTSKTKCLSFSRKTATTEFRYHLDDVPISRVRDTFDLGVVLDAKLLYSQHVSTLVNNCFSRLGALSKLCGRFTSTKMMIMLYNMYVRSKLEYGSILLGKIPVTRSHQLERVQRVFVGKLYDTFSVGKFLYSYETACSRFAIPFIYVRRHESIVLFFYKNLHNSIHCSSFNENFKLHIRTRPLRLRHKLFALPKSDLNPWYSVLQYCDSLPPNVDLFCIDYTILKTVLQSFAPDL